jgi:transposase-like protein
MPKSHVPYSPEFRARIIELVRKGRTPEQLARQFEPSAQAIRNWVRQADRDAGHREDGLTTTEQEELRRLRRENRTLREEREILKNTCGAPGAGPPAGRETRRAARRPRQVIHHSDHGSQYTSITFGLRCREAGVQPSMGSVGDAYDNALCESFFASRECELLDRRRFTTHAGARLAVFDYIEGWYNSRRRHSAFDYLSPIAYEKRELVSA